MFEVASAFFILFPRDSSIMFPITWMFSVMFSFIRFCLDALSGQNKIVEQWSVIILFISSGMSLSKERMPASMWAVFMCNFFAANAPARVEFVSPNMTTQSGFSFINVCSIFSSIIAVCCPCGPEPTFRL